MQGLDTLDRCRNILDEQIHMHTDRAAMLVQSVGSQECQPYTLANTLAHVSCLRLSYNSREMQKEAQAAYASYIQHEESSANSRRMDYPLVCWAQHCRTHNLNILHLLKTCSCRKAISGAYPWAGAGSGSLLLGS